ncbi:response regulator [Paenibacillus sp. LMG 31459]|uniref:Response regulator n=1 Tax=Paenibacillus phytohabitans TaxID=2654978 RepID=A0ABX1YDI0_9BACL|nr:response regulator [Paenibacillus phytohabitans]NOU79032.1 response regulator [Paenibacillus phytohabitans]
MKLLIVDDETRTRELLRSHIDWEEIGIDEVRTAHNGVKALSEIQDWLPEIILCDVRMPKMDGIEFAHQYRLSAPQGKIIFLSGYSDKEYLKSAIHLRALTYIEKPVNPVEVRSAVEAAVLLCLEEKKKFTVELQVQKDIDQSLPYLRQEMVRKLISNPASPHVGPAIENQETFLLPLKGPYTVAAANLYWKGIAHPEDFSLHQNIILDMINRSQRFSSLQVIAGFNWHNQLVLIIPGRFGNAYRDGRGTIEELFSELSQIAGEAIELRLGIGSSAGSLMEIPEAYNDAVRISAFQYYHDQNIIFFDSIGPSGSIDTHWDEVRRLRNHLRKGEIEEAKAALKEWTRYARTCMDLDILRLKDTYFQFMLAITETAVQLNLVEHTEDTERRYVWKEIDNIPSLNALEKYVMNAMDELFTAGLGEPKDVNIRKMQMIIRYIHANFHTSGFTIRAIADHVQFSETYLCAYFKKQQGQTIKEYITDVRINKAKELLGDMSMKLFEITVQLGFTDAGYFTTFFKRYVGCTPSEYRERILR